MRKQPLALSLVDQDAIYFQPRYFSIKIDSTNVPETLRPVEALFRRFSPGFPFECRFLDDRLESMYRSEQRLGGIFNAFSGMAVFIACLGLFGLSSFTAEKKTREIGIRKVLGATGPDISKRLTWQFLKWVVIANALAWPVAYFLMRNWLGNFAYRTSIGLWIFAVTAVSSLCVAMLTVMFQALKAANMDPASALRQADG